MRGMSAGFITNHNVFAFANLYYEVCKSGHVDMFSHSGKSCRVFIDLEFAGAFFLVLRRQTAIWVRPPNGKTVIDQRQNHQAACMLGVHATLRHPPMPPHVYTRRYAYIHTYTCTHIHMYTYIYTYTILYIYKYIYIYLHIYIHRYTDIHTYLHLYTDVHSCTDMHTYIHIYIYTYVHMYIYTHTARSDM